MSPIISVADLSKTYGSGFKALDNVNLDIERGEIFALLGPNGAGKTTLISIICGIANPTSGRIAVGGHDIVKSWRAARSLIGLVPQELHTDAFESVWATVSFSRGLFGRPKNPDHIEKVLKDLSLWDKKDAKIRMLSGGMKRRLMIAKALAHEPRILFLDEPTGGVDPISRRQFWRLIDQLSRSGVTVLVTTHYLDEAEYCRRIALIHAGKLAALGTTGELKQIFAERPIVEIRTRRAVDVMRALDAMDDVEESSLFGTAVHAVLRSRRVSAGDVVARLREQQIEIDSVDAVQPSLEDVFLDVVEKAGRS